jgi:hypothetical protein
MAGDLTNKYLCFDAYLLNSRLDDMLSVSHCCTCDTTSWDHLLHPGTATRIPLHHPCDVACYVVHGRQGGCEANVFREAKGFDSRVAM